MVKSGTGLLALLAVAVAGCAPPAKEPTLADESPTTSPDVSVALTPKLEAGTRYRVEIVSELENHRSGPVRKVSGKRIVKVEVLQKSGAGYLMSWEYGPFSITGSTGETVQEGSLRPDMVHTNTPLDGVRAVFFINAGGVPVELDNAPEVSTHLKKSDPRMAESVDSGTGMRIFEEPRIFYALSGRVVAGGPAHKYTAQWLGVRGVRADGHVLLREISEGGAIARVATQLFPDATRMRQLAGRELRMHDLVEQEFDLGAGRPRAVYYERITRDGAELGTVLRRRFRVLAD